MYVENAAAYKNVHPVRAVERVSVQQYGIRERYVRSLTL